MSKYEYFETVYIKDWWAVLPVDLLLSLEHIYLNRGLRREQLSLVFDDLANNVQLTKGDWSKYSFLRDEGIGRPRCGAEIITALEELGLVCDSGGRINIGFVKSVEETFPALPKETLEQIERHHSFLKNGVKIKEMMDNRMALDFSGVGRQENQVYRYSESVVCDKDQKSLMSFLESYVDYLLDNQQTKGGAS